MPGWRTQLIMNHFFQQKLMAEFFGYRLFIRLAQGGVYKGFHTIWIFQRIQPVINNLYPGGKGTVSRPDMKGNGSWRRNLLTGRAEISQSITCLHACVIANPASRFLIKFRLTDHASIMFTKIIHRLRLAFLPFQTERRTASPKMRILYPTWPGNQKSCCYLLAGIHSPKHWCFLKAVH